MEEREQALQIMNSLTKELKEARSQIKSLNNEIFRLKAPKVSFSNNSKSINVNNVLEQAKEAMSRNVERIKKEIENAKQKQSKR